MYLFGSEEYEVVRCKLVIFFFLSFYLLFMFQSQVYWAALNFCHYLFFCV